MNKIKFALVSLALVLGFTACNKNDYEYEPGKEAATDNLALYFDDEENLTLALADNEVEITLNRVNTEGELTVPLIVNTAPDFVTVPETATFAAGEDKTTIKLTIGEGMEAFTKYLIKISIPEEYTQPYDVDSGSPVYSFTITKEDFATVAKGVFTSTVAWKSSWENDLEFSNFLNLYRFPDLIASGTHIYFHFDMDAEGNQEFYFTDASGNHITKFSTGYIHPSYGEMTATVNEGYDMGYDEFVDEETGQPVNEFYWVWKITVSAGSFGENYQTYDVTEWLRRPWKEKNAQ
ncbi:MAG: hypothetical protein IJR69_01495 [Bacteroidaceae bacterium]|nr:hypothetical protein [Bacteroidaceae bacterium]